MQIHSQLRIFLAALHPTELFIFWRIVFSALRMRKSSVVLRMISKIKRVLGTLVASCLPRFWAIFCPTLDGNSDGGKSYVSFVSSPFLSTFLSSCRECFPFDFSRDALPIGLRNHRGMGANAIRLPTDLEVRIKCRGSRD